METQSYLPPISVSHIDGASDIEWPDEYLHPDGASKRRKKIAKQVTQIIIALSIITMFILVVLLPILFLVVKPTNDEKCQPVRGYDVKFTTKPFYDSETSSHYYSCQYYNKTTDQVVFERSYAFSDSVPINYGKWITKHLVFIMPMLAGIVIGSFCLFWSSLFLIFLPQYSIDKTLGISLFWTLCFPCFSTYALIRRSIHERLIPLSYYFLGFLSILIVLILVPIFISQINRPYHDQHSLCQPLGKYKIVFTINDYGAYCVYYNHSIIVNIINYENISNIPINHQKIKNQEIQISLIFLPLIITFSLLGILMTILSIRDYHDLTFKQAVYKLLGYVLMGIGILPIIIIAIMMISILLPIGVPIGLVYLGIKLYQKRVGDYM